MDGKERGGWRGEAQGRGAEEEGTERTAPSMWRGWDGAAYRQSRGGAEGAGEGSAYRTRLHLERVGSSSELTHVIVIFGARLLQAAVVRQ